MHALDWLVIGVYFAAVLGTGLVLGGRQRGAADYFLGRRGLPWWAIMLSIVATETSALTVISVPGIAARGDLTFLQLPLGYLVERMDELPADTPIVLHCQGGGRSMIAASLLAARGRADVINLEGGFGAWERAGLPVER